MLEKETLTMPKVKVNDIHIYYEVQGEGFPLVMIMLLPVSTPTDF